MTSAKRFVRRGSNAMHPRAWEYHICAILRMFLVSFLFLGAICGAAAQQMTKVSVWPVSETNDRSIHRTWQLGGYGEGGFAYDYHVGTLQTIRYRKEQEFYALTFEAGRVLTAIHGPRILAGNVEALGELTPFWLTHSPAQRNILYSNSSLLNDAPADFAAYSVHGLSLTPLMFRWNFTRRKSDRTVPWLQAGAGVLWTAKTFPQGGGYPGSYTSNFNFTPQVGIGEDVFVRKNQSLNVGMRVVGYGNFGLGEYDPGVPYTFNFSVGYSWWK